MSGGKSFVMLWGLVGAVLAGVVCALALAFSPVITDGGSLQMDIQKAAGGILLAGIAVGFVVEGLLGHWRR